MELWIRSQDKLTLTKVSNLSLQEIKHPVRHDTEYWGIGTYYDNLQMLGKYKTKERALEVLDEIQSKLKQQFIVKTDMLLSRKDIDNEEDRLTWKYDKEFIMQDSGYEIIPLNNNVLIYEMPKE